MASVICLTQTLTHWKNCCVLPWKIREVGRSKLCPECQNLRGIVLLDALSRGDKLGEFVNANLDAASENNEAAVIIFPEIVSADQIVALINTLCSCPTGRWYRTDDGIDPDPSGDLHLVGY